MRGICFVEDLFLQVVTGEKTETRRIIKPLVDYKDPAWFTKPVEKRDNWDDYPNQHIANMYKNKPGVRFIFPVIGAIIKPRYQPGEIVFLKEPYGRISGVMFYAFDYPPHSEMRTSFKGWANKLFMAASDARHFIKITGVSVERAWEITEEGAIREGVANRTEFEKKWAKINGISSWKPNPYVFVYSFEYLPNYKIC